MSWIVWEEQTCEEIDRLYRAISSRVKKEFKISILININVNLNAFLTTGQ